MDNALTQRMRYTRKATHFFWRGVGRAGFLFDAADVLLFKTTNFAKASAFSRADSSSTFGPNPLAGHDSNRLNFAPFAFPAIDVRSPHFAPTCLTVTSGKSVSESASISSVAARAKLKV